MRADDRAQDRLALYLRLRWALSGLLTRQCCNESEKSSMGISKTDIGTTTISIIATLAVWELLTRIFHIPGFIIPSPSAIFVEAVTRYPLYLSWITFYEMVVGFLLAAAVGVFLAVVIVYSRIIRNMIYSQIVVLQIVQ